MQLEVMVRMLPGGYLRRHYVLVGHVVALCGQETLRRPTWQENRHLAPLCRSCDAAAQALHRRESES